MAVAKRIIPCLDIKEGKVVKGKEFVGLKYIGDPIELAYKYTIEGADELVLLDITATIEKRKILLPLITEVARHITIPFTVGGGVSNIEDAYLLLSAGADKISVNSAAVKDIGLITDLSKRFGSQCVVLAVDAKKKEVNWNVYVNGGKIDANISVTDWVRQATDAGAGEILLTSIDQDGARNGYALSLLRKVMNVVTVPVIASGGAGTMEHFSEVLGHGYADAALAAGIFHEGLVKINELKKYLKEQNIPIRS
jgi:cyclase